MPLRVVLVHLAPVGAHEEAARRVMTGAQSTRRPRLGGITGPVYGPVACPPRRLSVLARLRGSDLRRGCAPAALWRRCTSRASSTRSPSARSPSGALVQGSIGFGLNLLSAPIIAILNPHALPATARAARAPAQRDHGAAASVTPSTAPAVALDAAAARCRARVVGLVDRPARVRRRPRGRGRRDRAGRRRPEHRDAADPRSTPGRASVAGLVSQSFGTAASVGGPPVAAALPAPRRPRDPLDAGARSSRSPACSRSPASLPSARSRAGRSCSPSRSSPPMVTGFWLSRHLPRPRRPRLDAPGDPRVVRARGHGRDRQRPHVARRRGTSARAQGSARRAVGRRARAGRRARGRGPARSSPAPRAVRWARNCSSMPCRYVGAARRSASAPVLGDHREGTPRPSVRVGLAPHEAGAHHLVDDTADPAPRQHHPGARGPACATGGPAPSSAPAARRTRPVAGAGPARGSAPGAAPRLRGSGGTPARPRGRRVRQAAARLNATGICLRAHAYSYTVACGRT